jgi:hypothetical protein
MTAKPKKGTPVAAPVTLSPQPITRPGGDPADNNLWGRKSIIRLNPMLKDLIAK